jgi:uncharacterized membrane protein
MAMRMMPASNSPDTGVNVGLLFASAMVPGTFARSLSARTPVDQGIATGMSVGLHYLLAVATQDSIQAMAAELAGSRGTARFPDPVVRQRALTMAADLAAIPVGLALSSAVSRAPVEAMVRGALRQSGWRLAATGLSGSLLIGAQTLLRVADTRRGGTGRIAAFPVAVPLGLGVALMLERRRMADLQGTEEEPAEPGPAALRSLAVAGGVVGGLAVAAYAEHTAASQTGRQLARVLPGGPQLWKLAGHATSLGLLTAAGLRVWDRAMSKIETGASGDEPVVEADEPVRYTSGTVSGSPDSRVPWSALGREGRRHVLAYVRPEPLVDRPAGAPDLSISTVMGAPAKQTPAQVYVSLDAAPTARERVDLALDEMERVGAFDRSMIMLISPTGSGYVNYVATAAASYLTLGDIATVTLQYSKRPSPLSLGKVKDAREQNRLLWLKILQRLHDKPGPRPRVVVFGESLGAHTSQDVFLHWGTMGPEALGIDRALWIGTPYGSGWMKEVTGPERLDVDKDAIAVVNDFGQLEDLGEERRKKLRYVLVSHDNDGVTKFGADLLTTAPGWLGPDRPKPQEIPGASPRGIPASMRWRPITTFFQSLIDMKNAQIPGAYRAWAHDYRPDLARFISEVYDLPVSPEQLARVEAALETRGGYLEKLFTPAPKDPAAPDRAHGDHPDR